MFSKYKYVHTLYREQSFTKAAEKLFISQPSLSAAIKGIEKDIGAPLFERTGSGIVPTDVGKVYVEAVEKIVKIENECIKKINDIYNIETGSISVGGTNYLTSYVLPKVINKFTQAHPNIEVTIVEAHSANLREMIKNDEIDLVIDSFEDDPTDFEAAPLVNENILLCVPSNRKINEELEGYHFSPEDVYTGKVKIEDFAPVPVSLFKNEKYVALKKGNDMYVRAMNIFKKADINPKIVFSVDQMNIAYAMAASGIGLCFATDTLFRYGKFSDDIALYNILESGRERALYVAYKKNRYCTKGMQKFIEIANEIIV